MDFQDISTLIQNAGVPVVIALYVVEKAFAVVSKTKNSTEKPDRTNEDTGKTKTQNDVDIALIKQKLITIETNHLKHIQDWMDKHDKEHVWERRALLQIAFKMHIDPEKLKMDE